MFQILVDWLVGHAQRTPYWHLLHSDNTTYMGRWWLVPYRDLHALAWWRNPMGWLLQRFDIAVRIHHIATADLDRALHDHPWDFISIVLRGGYLEARPGSTSPCFYGHDFESTFYTERLVGSIGYRRATDRHRIISVKPNTYTLFITFRKVQWWGFYTPMGKIYYRDYESVHNKEAAQ